MKVAIMTNNTGIESWKSWNLDIYGIARYCIKS